MFNRSSLSRLLANKIARTALTSAKPTPRSRPWIVALLSLALLVGGTPLAIAQGDGKYGNRNLGDLTTPPPVESSVRTAYLGLYPSQTMVVTVADVADASPGALLIVSFYDTANNLLGQSQGILRPGQPVTASLDAAQLGITGLRELVRVEIDAVATEPGGRPVTTIERLDGQAFAAQQEWTCSGPPLEHGIDWDCSGGITFSDLAPDP